MQKIIILALLCAVAFATITPVDLCTATTAGYYRTQGVCHQCHPSCKTCEGPLKTDCNSCHNAAYTGPTDAAKGACICPTADQGFGGAQNAAPACGATMPFDNAVCAQVSTDRLVFTTDQVFCQDCDDKCETCVEDGDNNLTTKCDACWGTLDHNGNACEYVVGVTYVFGHAAANWDSATHSVNGYFLNTSTYEWERCLPGCKTCTTAADCSTCSANYTQSGTTCACTGAFFEDADKQVCTACTESTCATCDSAGLCLSCKEKDGTSAAWEKNSDSTKCVEPAAVVEEDKVETEADANTAANIKPPTTCEATLIGCTACDAADKAKCTACAEKYFQKLNATTNSCDCDATHARNPDGGCGTKCTATCATGEMCKVDAAAKQTCSAAGTSTSTNGLLLTAASMIFAVILA